ncbi:hypothetical protein [Conexibacter sp. CPCC 206217]|uniref:hypothetical protein n=1 Tax=Conexibacter sp. CPCC 206217 TaxID=3064574 RepID=UPI00272217D0|nr:hypothetical protein [Conexibacter sp. CPCC 206217]MDO8212893.1 hypothetical protein [Conexibacter sp. CPCC 206217]
MSAAGIAAGTAAAQGKSSAGGAAGIVTTAQARKTAPRPAPAALVTGTMAGGGARFRLEGRLLTVTLRAPLSRLPRGGQRLVARCGDSVGNGFDEGEHAPIQPLFTSPPAQRAVHVARGARTVRVRLPRDVAARANHCTLIGTRGRAQTVRLQAQMRLGAGARPSCAPAPAERVLASDDELLVTDFAPSEALTGFNDDHYIRTCLTSSGRPRALTAVSNYRYGGSSIGSVVVNGTWVAWITASGDTITFHDQLSVSVADVGRDSSRPTTFTYVNDNQAAAMRISQLALADDGALAFPLVTTRSNGFIAPNGMYEQHYDYETRVEAGRPGGRAVTLATVDADSITGAAFAEGTSETVTWLEAGVPRSAALPRG